MKYAHDLYASAWPLMAFLSASEPVAASICARIWFALEMKVKKYR